MKKEYYETREEMMKHRKPGERIYYVAGKGYYVVKKRLSFWDKFFAKGEKNE